MKKNLIEEMYIQEHDYWWHVGKRLIVKKIIEKYKPSDKPRILVLGTGTGLLNYELIKDGYATFGIDISFTCLAFCRERKIKNILQADFNSGIPILSEKFDIILCLDVLEHLDNDTKAISEIRRLLRKDGIAIFTVPAYQSFWSKWDEVLGHKRRYNKESIYKSVNQEELKLIKITHFNMFILPLVFFFRKIKEFFTKERDYSSDFFNLPPRINQFLLNVSCFESYLLCKTTLQFGLSILFVLKKYEN